LAIETTHTAGSEGAVVTLLNSSTIKLQKFENRTEIHRKIVLKLVHKFGQDFD